MSLSSAHISFMIASFSTPTFNLTSKPTLSFVWKTISDGLPDNYPRLGEKDSQPLKSVMYVSIGSVAIMTRDELVEFWYGLVNSRKRFLWVIRPDLYKEAEDGKNVPEELLEETKKRGYVVGWAPQEEVLEHPAVGGFLTHSGWNSTMESLVAGVPMICWPRQADQPVNSRYVSEVWKIGLDMNDVSDRKVVEKW
ncbi:hypothetical protein FNV43_RR08495 [Rhamnella rubrinervis]|uniref:UDP-glycosyltransferases domain-containing protein n=1 Tax=Rhamnella rubrinervis TaxID=2594499 RepID=A0A8K0H8P3_9ROSA|nr:hypothetical protein FNV43_RR08495 [Rhamnella rubrinervis]